MTEQKERPLGKLFTEVYRDRGGPVRDTPKFRVQLYALLEELFQIRLTRRDELATFLRRKAGVSIPAIPTLESVFYDFEAFITDSSIDELLDFITYVSRYLSAAGAHPLQRRWVEAVRESFDVQRLNYEIDEEGGVHHRIDAAFDGSKALTLVCLAGAKFSQAHDEIEKAFSFLTSVPSDNKMAVVNAFLAAENLFKIVIGSGVGLTDGTVRKELRPIVKTHYAAAHPATQRVAGNLVESFASWACACHPYRHGQDGHEVVAPPDEIAITLVTTGADFIRWLVELTKGRAETAA